MNNKPRARELGLPFPGETGPENAITDVDGVLVGCETLIDHNPASWKQTGVTAILPRGRSTRPQPVWAGMYALNGNGEMTGTHWIQDGGYFTGPVLITNSHAVGMAHHAAVRWTIQQYQEAWQGNHLWAMPVVAETFDGILNDINALHIREQDVLAALDKARSGPVPEGNVGGGAGMIAYDYKGGTGTASRRVRAGGQQYTTGVLVQANHGIRRWLNILGAPYGAHHMEDLIHPRHEQGSIIVIIATDAPMLPHQLRRLAKRAAIGIGRNGSPGGNNSGDIFLAFSTANQKDLPQLSGAHQSMDYLNDEVFDDFYLATVEATEEAVVNAMVAAEDVPVFRMAESPVCRAIDTAQLKAFVQRFHNAL